jgi:hypothetical protein
MSVCNVGFIIEAQLLSTARSSAGRGRPSIRQTIQEKREDVSIILKGAC